MDKSLYNKCLKYDNWVEGLARILWPEKSVCSVCKGNTKFAGLQRGIFSRHCSASCRALDPTVKDKREKSCMRKYGVKAPLQNKDVMDKFKRHNIEKYGVAFPVSLPEHVKSRAENYKKNSKEYSTRSRASLLKKYGVEYPLQYRPIFEKQQKAGFLHRVVETKTKTFKVRGYEDIAINYLIHQRRISPKHILTTHAEGVPTLRYVGLDNKQHNYHPDIYLKKFNTLIEVKSTYTAGLTIPKSGLFSIIKRKLKACEDAGYKAVLLIIDRNHVVYRIDNVTSKTRKQIKLRLGID